jgi:hypothetical protein
MERIAPTSVDHPAMSGFLGAIADRKRFFRTAKLQMTSHEIAPSCKIGRSAHMGKPEGFDGITKLAEFHQRFAETLMTGRVAVLFGNSLPKQHSPDRRRHRTRRPIIQPPHYGDLEKDSRKEGLCGQ